MTTWTYDSLGAASELLTRIASIKVPEGWTLGTAYLRVSTDKQEAQQQLGIIRQAANRAHVHIPDELVFTDQAVSRSLGTRGGLDDLLIAITHPAISSTWCWEFSRAIGSGTQKARVFRAFRANDIGFFDSKGERRNLPGAVHKFRANVDSAMSEYEVDRLRERVRETHEEKVRAGDKIVMRPLYGLCHSKAHELRTRSKLSTFGKITNNGCTSKEVGWHRHSEEFSWLERMFGWAASNESCVDIEKRLVAAGVRTKQGRPWSRQKVRIALTNRFYVGEVVWGKKKTHHDDEGVEVEQLPETEWVRGTSPMGVLIDPVIFEQVQRNLTTAHKTRGYSKRKYPPHYYDKLMFCGQPECGRRMYRRKHYNTPRATSDLYSYTCTGRNSSLYSQCPTGCTISERKVRRALEEAISLAGRLVEGKLVRIQQAPDAGVAEQEKRIKEALKGLEPRRANARRMATAGAFDPDEYVAAKKELAAEQAQLEVELADLAARRSTQGEWISEGKAALSLIMKKLDSPYIPVEEKQMGLAAVLDRLSVRAGKVTVQFRKGDFLPPLQP